MIGLQIDTKGETSMNRWRVEGLTNPGGSARIVSEIVEAKSRSAAITEASKRFGIHRDMIVSCKNLNPASGGGSKRG